VEYVKGLVDKGHATQILLSHDVCTKPHLRAHGGQGYTYVTGEFADRLARAGISRECIQTILERNPTAALGVGQ
jgi:phosphotriesterase-related protein